MMHRVIPSVVEGSILLVFIGFFLIFGISPVFAADIVINEVFPHPSSGDDWIELYKPAQIEIDLSGWKIKDSTSVAKTFEDGTKFASSSSYFQVALSNRLNNSGDTIKLEDNNGNIVDEKNYSSDPGIGISLGRYPDGSDSWGILTNATPDNSNSNYSPTSTPTITPTPSSVPPPPPTNTPSPSNTPKPQNSPTTKPTLTHTPPSPSSSLPSQPKTEDGGEVLGQSVNQATEAESQDLSTSSAQKTNTPQILMLFLIGGGFIFIALAMFLSYRKKLNTLP